MPRDIQPEIGRVHAELHALLAESESGRRFLSYPAIMKRFGSSRRVVERALDRLKAEGLVRVEPQSGIFVVRKPVAAEKRIVVVHTDWACEYWQTLDAKFEKAFAEVPGWSFSRALVDPGTGRDFFGMLDRKLADAVLLTYAFGECGQADVARLLSCEIPIVFLENHITCDGLNTIDSEPEYTGMLAADHLLRNGHREIALILSESADLCVRREIDGFVRYLQLHGVSPLTIDCRHGNCESSLGTTEKLISQYLERHGAVFTGCFVLSVFAAIGFCRAARSLGYSIPEDFSVIANSEVPSAERCDPPLTTLARDFDGYVREIRDGLENLFQGRPFGVHRVPSLLVERESVYNLNRRQTKKGGSK